MKKQLFYFLTTLFYINSTSNIQAQCSLDQVGTIPNYVAYAQLSDFAIAPNNTLYSISYSSSDTKTHLYSTTVPGSWSLITSLTSSTTVKPVINVASNGTVYVFVRDEPAGKVGKVYYLSGSSLVQVGPPVSGSNVVSDLSIAFNSSNEVFVAYTDVSNAYKSTVKKWDGVSAWVPLGGGGGTVSSGAGYYNSLIIDNTNIPVLAFQSVATGSTSAVRSFDGSAWNLVGTPSIGLAATNQKLKAASNGDYYLGYTESSNNAVAVQKYSGSSWSQVGSSVPSINSVANSFDLELDPTDMPYFIGIAPIIANANVYRYAAGSWINIASNISSGNSVTANLSFDTKGNPYFSYVSTSFNNSLNSKTLTSPISITSQPNSLTVCNGNSGLFNIATSGGTPTYQWQTSTGANFVNSGAPYSGSTTNNLSFLANPSLNQNKLRCVVDATCKNIISNTATLTVPNTPIISFITVDPTCSYSSNGTINSTISGAPGPFNYSWSPGMATTPNLINVPAGLYTLNVTDFNGCSVSSSTNLISPPSINSSFSGNMTICQGSTTTLTINATGGTGGLTYSWTPGATLSSTTSSVVIANPLSSITYTVSITDANACVATSTVMVNVINSPTLAISPSNVSICQGSGTMLTVSGADTYTWMPGNTNGTSAFVTPPVGVTIYTVTGTYTSTGCSKSSNFTITVNPLPIANAGPTRTLTCANTSTTLAGSGGSTYNWTGPGIVSGSTTTNPTINSPGIYSLVVTSAAACTSTTSTVSVTQNTTAPIPSASTSGTLTCVTTSVTLNGAPGTGVTYLWSGPGITGSTSTQTTSANLPGTYTLKATSSVNGCTNTAVTSVTQNTTAPSPTASNSSSLTCATTTVALNGAPGTGVTYQWSGPGFSGGTTSQNAIATAAGTYSLKVTSSINGCTNTAVTSITQNTTTPSANAGMDLILTCSSPTVSLNGSASPSTCTPVWTGGVASGANSFNAVVNAAGDYTLTVTNPSNGCSATDQVLITANTIAPTVTVSVSNTLTCLSTIVNATATTTSTPVTYLWSGPGIVSGATTSNPTINQPGTYSVNVTNTSTGCSALSNINVLQNITVPTITVTASPTVICSGNSSTLTANGATTYTWNTAQTTNSISVSPNITSSYSVNGTGTNGCIGSATETILVNTTPTLSITGNTNICKGSTTNLTANGATSYTWNSGASTNTISVTPTVTTTYTVNGDNGNGCSSSVLVTVSLISSKNISGIMTSTAGATTGDVTLYKYTLGLSLWDSVTTVPFSTSYSFSNIDSALYVVRAVPTATNIQVTYGYNASSWQNASIITHGCTNNTNQDIDLIALNNIGTGPGVLTGLITEATGFGQRMSGEFKPLAPGQPIGGIIVKGGRNPGGQMFTQTITSSTPGSEGTYTLTGLPLNTGTDSYFIFVDLPGLDTNGTYHLVVSAGNTVFNNLNFNVDSMYINPTENITSIKTQNVVLENGILIYPNPTKDIITLKYELIQSANVAIDLYNVVGEKVQVISELNFQEKNKHQHSVNLQHLANGVYFINFKINNADNYIKIIKNN